MHYSFQQYESIKNICLEPFQHVGTISTCWHHSIVCLNLTHEGPMIHTTCVEQWYTLRVWHVIILLMRAKCLSPACVHRTWKLQIDWGGWGFREMEKALGINITIVHVNYFRFKRRGHYSVQNAVYYVKIHCTSKWVVISCTVRHFIITWPL